MSRPLTDLPRPLRDPHHVTATVHRVLSRRPYVRPGPSWQQRISDFVTERLRDLLSVVARPGLLGWTVLVLVVALVAVLVWRFGRGISVDRGGAAFITERRSRPPAEWRAEADAHERAGEWRQALRCRYRALVADLARRGVLEEIPGRTAGEYRSELSNAVPAAGPPFSGATELFERAWYGGRPTGADEARRFRELETTVLRAAP